VSQQRPGLSVGINAAEAFALAKRITVTITTEAILRIFLSSIFSPLCGCLGMKTRIARVLLTIGIIL